MRRTAEYLAQEDSGACTNSLNYIPSLSGEFVFLSAFRLSRRAERQKLISLFTRSDEKSVNNLGKNGDRGVICVCPNKSDGFSHYPSQVKLWPPRRNRVFI